MTKTNKTKQVPTFMYRFKVHMLYFKNNLGKGQLYYFQK